MKGLLKIHWANGRDNFGDSVTPELLRFLLGREIVWAGKWDGRALTIGSLLGWALVKRVGSGFGGRLAACRMALRRLLSGRVVVCGSGFLHDPFVRGSRPVLRRRPLVLAVRGRLTLEALRRLDALEDGRAVALGDPGLLFSDLWPDIRKNPTAKSRAYVPHESAWGGAALAAFSAAHPEIRIVDVRRPPRDVYAALADCGEIYSSSLHGLIAADALAIPNRWVSLDIPGRSEEENRFKFDDYYSAYGLSRDPLALAEVRVATVGDQVPRQAIERAQANLRSAFSVLRNLT